MDSPEDSAQPPGSPVFSFLNTLSPIKPFRAAPVAQGFPGLNSPPLVFTSPRINSEHSSSSLTRPQFPQLSSDDLLQRGDDKLNNSVISIYESGNSDMNFRADKGNDDNDSLHDIYEYLAEPLEVDCGDPGHLSNLSLKHSAEAPSSANGFVACKEDDIAEDVRKVEGVYINGDNLVGFWADQVSKEQQKEHSETKNEVYCRKFESLSTSHFKKPMAVKELKYCSELSELISSDQNMVLHDSKASASQPQFSMPRRCLQFDALQQDSVPNNPGFWNQLEGESDSISPTNPADVEVQESSYANMRAAPSSVQLEKMKKPVLSMFPVQNFSDSGLTASGPSGFGVHLNTVVSAAMSMASERIKPAEWYLNVQGEKSHLTENAWNPLTSSNVIESLVRAEETKRNIHSFTEASLATPSSPSLNSLYNVLYPKATGNHSTACDERVFISELAEGTEDYAQKNPGKRKKTQGSTDGDGCKHCNCKKTKCLKLYCDCFAAGNYCDGPCLCLECLNKPEYEDTVIETRKQIESRNPLAFAPKIVNRVTEHPANCTPEDIIHSTPSSVRHKRGCNCKKSMCLKKYCECYQSNVGCSDGCRCEGCKNVYGKKDEYGTSKDNINIQVTTERSESAFEQKLDMVATRNGLLQTELPNPHSAPLAPLIRCSEFPQSTESNIASSAPNGNPPGSPRGSGKGKEAFDVLPFDQEVYGNSKRADDFSAQGHGNTNPFSIQQNPPWMPVSSITPMPRVWRNDSNAQLHTASYSFSPVYSQQWRGSSVSPISLLRETKLPQVLDSSNEIYNIIEDDNAPEILRENPIPATAVKSASPNKKRVSAPHGSNLHELESSISAGLRSGRKFVLKGATSFRPLTPCIDAKETISKSTDDPESKYQ